MSRKLPIVTERADSPGAGESWLRGRSAASSGHVWSTVRLQANRRPQAGSAGSLRLRRRLSTIATEDHRRDASARLRVPPKPGDVLGAACARAAEYAQKDCEAASGRRRRRRRREGVLRTVDFAAASGRSNWAAMAAVRQTVGPRGVTPPRKPPPISCLKSGDPAGSPHMWVTGRSACPPLALTHRSPPRCRSVPATRRRGAGRRRLSRASFKQRVDKSGGHARRPATRRSDSRRGSRRTM
jgi:hypothetical protein